MTTVSFTPQTPKASPVDATDAIPATSILQSPLSTDHLDAFHGVVKATGQGTVAPYIDVSTGGTASADTPVTAADSVLYQKEFGEGESMGKSMVAQANGKVPLGYAPNTNPPGMHDSRSEALIMSDPDRKEAFQDAPVAEKLKYLNEADAFLAGVDQGIKESVTHKGHPHKHVKHGEVDAITADAQATPSGNQDDVGAGFSQT